MYPNWFFATTQDCMWWLHVQPKGPRRSIVTQGAAFPRSTAERPDFDEVVQKYYKWWDKSLPEDTDLCLRIAAVQENTVWMWDPAKVMQHRVPAGRATFGYLMSRCFLQGWGKAAMAHMDGFDESTSTERYYALRILPAGVGRGLADTVRGDFSGLGRSGAIVAAFSVTVGGYLWYLLESRFRKKTGPGQAATA